MARIFISHSSRDEEQAARLIEWLRAQGLSEVFLDFDKHAGLAPGSDWERRLYREIAGSDAVLLVVTENWFASKWCFAEFTQARALGKPIFPLLEEPRANGVVSPDIQQLDITKDRDANLERLGTELRRIILAARGDFHWDDTRSPFPGLLSLEEADAAVYFGRDDDVRRLIERLNARRIQGGAKLVVVLGASGSGKSSLLRAGVLPRLRRDERHWIVLPAFRPQVHPLDELVQAISAAQGHGDRQQLRSALSAGGGGALNALMHDLRAAHKANEASILVSIDQGEELFGTADAKETQEFWTALSALLAADLPTMAIMTIRSDYLGQLQQVANLEATFEEFSLKPLPLERIRSIIEGPAKVVGLGVDDDMVAAAMRDAATDDALPLLAFTLRELYDRFGTSGRLTLQQYEAQGSPSEGLSPLENAVRQRADEVLREAKPDDDDVRALKGAFIPAMVRVNAEGEYVRRPADLENLPARSHALLDRLAAARLLVIRSERGRRVVEVAHEALLRKWPLLRSWLDEEREFLIGKDQLEQDVLDWESAPQSQKAETLLSGLKRTRAHEWLLERPHQLTETERAFIRESVAYHEAEQARKRQVTRRVQIGGIAAAAVLALVAIIAVIQWRSAVSERQQAQDLRWTSIWKVLAFEAPGELQAGDDDLAELLAKQAFSIEQRLPRQPTNILDDSLYSAFPTGQFRHILRGHSAAVLSIAFTPDGRKLISGSWDRTIRIWDLQQPQTPAIVLSTPEAGIWAVAMSPDGRTFASGHDDGTVRVWSLSNPQSPPLRLLGHRGTVQSVAYSPDSTKLVSAGEDGTVRVWDLSRPGVATIFHVPSAQALSTAVSPNGEQIAAGSSDGSVRIWNLRTAAQPTVLHGNSGSVWSVAFSRDGRYLASGAADRTIRIWNLRALTAQPLVLRGDMGEVRSVVFSADSRTLLSGAGDGTVRMWSLSNPHAAPLILSGGSAQGAVRSVAFSPDGRRVAAGSEDTQIRIWELRATRAPDLSLRMGNRSVETVAFSPNRTELAFGDGGDLDTWNMAPGARASAVPLTKAAVQSLAFSPSGKILAVGAADDVIRLVDTNGRVQRVLAGHTGGVWSVAFNRAGNLLASGSADGTVRVWNLGHADAPPLVLSVGSGGQIYTSAERACFLPIVIAVHQRDVYSVAFSPDGRYLAAGSADEEVRIWDLRRPDDPPQILRGHQDYVCSVAFSPDGKTLASGSGDNSIRLWSLAHPSLPPVVLAGHSDNVLSIAFSPDGERLASGSSDGTIRIWDLSQPQALPLVLARDQGRVLAVAFNADGSVLASGNADGTVHVWDQAAALAAIDCQLVWRNLSMDEWRFFVGEAIPYERTCSNLPSGLGAPQNAPAAEP